MLVCHCSWIISQFTPGTHKHVFHDKFYLLVSSCVRQKIDNFFLPRAKGPCYKAGPCQLWTRKICSSVWPRKTSQVKKYCTVLRFWQTKAAWTWEKGLTTRKTCQGKRARSSLLSTGLLINTVTFSIILRKIWEKQIKNSRSYRSVRKLIHTPIYIWHSGLFLSFRTY